MPSANHRLVLSSSWRPARFFSLHVSRRAPCLASDHDLTTTVCPGAHEGEQSLSCCVVVLRECTFRVLAFFSFQYRRSSSRTRSAALQQPGPSTGAACRDARFRHGERHDESRGEGRAKAGLSIARSGLLVRLRRAHHGGPRTAPGVPPR